MLKAKMIRGLTTGWIQRGQDNPLAPILFFIHGFPDDPEVWEGQIDYFSENYLVIAPFTRGVGPSEENDQTNRFSPTAIAMDHLAILREVDPQQERKIVVIGHDIGALHAWTLARLLDHRLDRLVIINGVSSDQMMRRLRQWRQVVKSWYIGLFQIPKIPELVTQNFWNWVQSKMDQRPGREIKPKEFLPPVNQYRMAVRQAFKESFRRNRKIQAPLLVLWGKDDPYLNIPTKKEINRLATHFQIRVLDGDHWVFRKKAEETNRHISNFIRDGL